MGTAPTTSMESVNVRDMKGGTHVAMAKRTETNNRPRAEKYCRAIVCSLPDQCRMAASFLCNYLPKAMSNTKTISQMMNLDIPFDSCFLLVGRQCPYVSCLHLDGPTTGNGWRTDPVVPPTHHDPHHFNIIKY